MAWPSLVSSFWFHHSGSFSPCCSSLLHMIQWLWHHPPCSPHQSQADGSWGPNTVRKRAPPQVFSLSNRKRCKSNLFSWNMFICQDGNFSNLSENLSELYQLHLKAQHSRTCLCLFIFNKRQTALVSQDSKSAMMICLNPVPLIGPSLHSTRQCGLSEAQDRDSNNCTGQGLTQLHRTGTRTAAQDRNTTTVQDRDFNTFKEPSDPLTIVS